MGRHKGFSFSLRSAISLPSPNRATTSLGKAPKANMWLGLRQGNPRPQDPDQPPAGLAATTGMQPSEALPTISATSFSNSRTRIGDPI